MIDLHCHLLDGTSDSPESFEASLAMCRQAAVDDVRTILATPRWAAHLSEPPLAFDECCQKLERLNEAMRAALSLRPGFLMEFRSDLPAILDRYGSSITLGGGHYLFVALPRLHVPSDVDEVWSKVSERGFSILLARAECSPALRRDSARLERWLESGMMLQLDAASITGQHGHEIQQFALQCVKKYEGSVVLASSVGGARQTSLATARELLLKKNPSRRVTRLLYETPAMMIDDDRNASGKEDARAFRLSRFSRLRALRSHRAVPDES
jgi:protein-tyrosine phosphatase